MGYDSSECLICYCESGFNNYCGGNCHNICADCFIGVAPTGLRGRATLSSYVLILPDVICDFCETETICAYQVAICHVCVGVLNPNGKELQDNTIEYTCSGYCRCPYCPSNNESLKEGFYRRTETSTLASASSSPTTSDSEVKSKGGD